MADLRELLRVNTAPGGVSVPAPPAGPDALRVNVAPDVSGLVDEASANGMGQLRRGFVSGRIGGEVNALREQQSRLRAGGRHAEADEAGAQADALQRRAALYAPNEQEFTKLSPTEPGRAVDYVLGQAGQGTASMLDSAGMIAAGNVAGNVVGRIHHPLATAASLLLRGGGVLGGYLNMAQQAKGEFYGDALQDPTIMRDQSAQEIDRRGNVFGALSGAVDTALPGAIGGRVVGRAGLKALGGLGLGKKIGLDLAGEGLQEATQEAGKHFALGTLNPNRDTSGDADAIINSFAGGVAGAGPLSAGSHVVAKGFKRLGVEDDKSSDDVSGKPRGNESLVESLVRGSKERIPSQQAEAWRNTLLGVPPESAEDLDPTIDAQHAALTKELASRAAKGDTVAQGHLDALAAQDMTNPTSRYDEAPRAAAAAHILGDGSDHERLIKAYEQRQLNSQRALNTQTFPGVKVGSEHVAYADLGSGKEGGVEVAPTPEAQKAYSEERQTVRARAALTADVMTSEVPDGAKPQLKKIAGDLGREIAEFGGSGYKKPTPGDQARVQRIGAQLVHLYGNMKAQNVLAKISATAGVDGTPLSKVLQSSVEAAKNIPQYQARQAVARDAAAQQLVAVIPPRAQLTLRRAGLDLTTPEGRAEMLDHVEGFFDNEHERPAMAFNKTFGGAETVEKMRQIVGQRLEPRVEALKSIGADQKTASDAARGKTSDDQVQGEEDDAARIKADAEKTLEKSPGTKEYFFKAGRSANSTDGAHPFTPDRKTKNLPTLAKLDDTDKASGQNTLQHIEAQAYKALGIEDDNTALPTTRVRTISAKEVMDSHGVAPEKRVELMRDYLARMKDGKVTLSRDDPTVQQLQTIERKIARAAQTTPQRLTTAVGKNGALTKENPAYAELRELQGQREEVAAKLAAKIGVVHKEGMTARDMANAYFADRHLVVAEQMGEKDQLRLDRAEVKTMAGLGERYLKHAMNEKKNGVPAQAMEADMNLIRFKSPHATSGSGVAAIPASALVQWVYDHSTAFKERDFNTAETHAHDFRNALMEGIGALVADGHATELPYMINAEGKEESFKDGFPPSLKLSTMTQAGLEAADKRRREKSIQKHGPRILDSGNLNPEAVAEEQAVEHVPSTDIPEELRHQGSEREAPAKGTQGELLLDPDQKAPKARPLNDKGERFWDAPETEDTRSPENRVPSETEPREQRSGVPTDRSELRNRNSELDAALPQIETLTMTNAMRKAEGVADGIWAQFGMAPREAYARLQRLVAALGHPEFRVAGENGPVGGRQYAAPLAYLLTPDRVTKLVAVARDGPKAKAGLELMRSEVARALSRKVPEGGQGFATHELTKLTRMLVGNDRISAPAVPAVLKVMAKPAWAVAEAAKASALKTKTEPVMGAPAKNAQERQLNAQTTPAGVQSSENAAPFQDHVEEARAYVSKVLGPKIRVQFEKTFDAAGEWVKAENLIKLALSNGKGMLTVAHHEAMHAFWDSLVANHPKAAAALGNVLGSERVLERLQALLHNESAALAQIAKSPTERVAYAFQFWAAGALDVDKPATTIFAKLRRFLRTVFGMVRESETALDIMIAFHDGRLAEESAAGRVIKGIMARQTWNEDVKRRFDKQLGFIHSMVAPSNDVLRKETLSATAQALGLSMFTNPGEEAAGRFKEGYINARARVTRQYTNFLYAGLKGLSERDLADTAKQLQLKTKLEAIPFAPVREAVKAMRALTKRYYEYANEAGLQLEYLAEDHYPRVWSLNSLIEAGGKEKFIAMVTQPKYAETMAVAVASAGGKISAQEAAGLMYQHLIDKNGVDEKGLTGELQNDVVLSPFFASQKERSFKWLDDADVEPFLEKDVVGAMSRYLHQGVRAAEFTRRFGVEGKELKELLALKGDMALDENGKEYRRDIHGKIAAEMEASIKEQGITGQDAAKMLARHMDDVRKSVAAHDGSLGNAMTPEMRKLSGFAMAYQNLRLLPMSLFAAFGDIGAIAAAGGGAKGAYEAFQQGLKDVYLRWKDAASDMPAERVKSMWDKIAEAVGAVDSHMFLEQMGKAHTSEFMTDFARKSNRALFMANGLTAWDRSMRVSATKLGVLFLQHHAGLPDKQHSARWLAELGLKADDVPLDASGNLIWDRHVLAAEKGVDLKKATEQAEKIHYALVRYVERSVLSPNAASRPTWASDPHYSVLFHLKQFTYSMQHTVLKRALNEAAQGNMNPVGALAATIPVMIASDLIKGMVMGGGSLPTYMRGWTAVDWIEHGASRAGLAGVSQFGLDALHDPSSLLGPTVEQVTHAVLNPSQALGTLHSAVPGVNLIKGLPDLTRAMD